MKKILVSLLAVFALLVVVGGVMYATNGAPAVAPLSPTDPAFSTRPLVVKLHAKWCANCMMTKGVWTELESTYKGRANFLVLDFTNATSTAAAEAEARRLGLGKFYEEHAGSTGSIVVLEPGGKGVRGEISGKAEFSEYAALVDGAAKSR